MYSRKQKKASRHARNFHGNKYIGGNVLSLKEKEVLADLTVSKEKQYQPKLNRTEKRARARQYQKRG